MLTDTMTERWEDPNKPAFMTVLLRFFGNIFGRQIRDTKIHLTSS